tara:strand:+ start:12462 stop:14333 length:1872 start_codon:yes stop_codon:yes gene_type:complete
MADTSLFSRLQRLFSTDVVIRNVGGDNLKIIDTNKIQSSGKYTTNSLTDRFTRLYNYNQKNVFNPNLNYQTLRVQLYSDYEAMDTDPILSSALDILADEISLKNEYGEILAIKSTDDNIQATLQNLHYDILNLEFNLWGWARNLCKYGDFFLKLEIADELGIYNVLPYTVYNMTRSEGEDIAKPAEVKFRIDVDGIAFSADPSHLPTKSEKVIELENYEVAHFRLLADTNYLPYGRSYFEPARKIHKQLTLMEDAMLIHRIVRSAEKRMFYINVGAIPPNEVEQFMQKTVDSIKKTPYVDPQTGDYNLKFNLQNMMEDFYLPVRGNDTNTRIETTPGLAYDGATDVEYLRDKMFAALKIPKAYFGYEGDLNGRATLAAEDIRFARTVERMQRIMESELTKISLIHLYAQGFRGEELTNFEIKLSSPSIIYEQEKIALLKEKMDLVGQMKDTQMFSTDWIYDKLFDLSDQQIIQQRDLVREDTKRDFRLTQISSEGNDPLESGKTYGTPHDLASIYKANNDTTDGKVPDGYDETKDTVLGRPQERASFIGTQDDPLGGRDRLGIKQTGTHDYNDPKNGSKLSEAKKLFLQNQELFSDKNHLFKKSGKGNEPGLLNEDNIKGLID